MKTYIKIFILLLKLNSIAQTKIKFESEKKELNINFILPKLLDENDIMHSLGFKDKNNFYNLKTLKLDSLKTYRLYLDNPWFLKVDEKLNLNNYDTLIVKLKPNPNCNCKTFSKDLLVMNCPYYNFGTYIAKEPRNLNELPYHISSKVKEYILSKVGKKFYKNVYFKKGQIIDSIPYKKYFANSKMNIRYHYYLCFAYSNPEKGVGEYTSNIELDEFGNILKDIDFPNNNSNINKLVSLSEIKKKAILNKFYIQENTKTEMNYESNKNILIWKFINEEYLPNGIFIQKELIYNAHNGKFLDIKTIQGIWEE
jgi:hypothetical protein